MSLVNIDPRRARARKAAKRLLLRACDMIDSDSDLAGFAIVTWDGRGAVTTVFDSTLGPISRSLVPALVHDALNRHVIIDDTMEAITGRGLPPPDIDA